ncbi:MAG: helix-turn-helix domain-containing protein [Alphaproteobacteria bacterium]|nr:helix-turn-helix domain-containing protein [Alphaproteobacteria bacterium]
MTDSTNGPAAAVLRPRRGGRPVNEELRGLAVAAVLEGGMSAAAAARHFALAASSVRRWIRQFRECGHVRPEIIGGSDSRIEPERERILRILAARPAISMYGLRDALAAEGLVFHATTVQRFLKRHGLDRDRRLARLYRKRKAGRR